MTGIIKKLNRSIDKIEYKVKILKEKHGDRPCLNYTYYGGWELGYLEGMLSVLKDFLENIEDENRDLKLGDYFIFENEIFKMVGEVEKYNRVLGKNIDGEFHSFDKKCISKINF